MLALPESSSEFARVVKFRRLDGEFNHLRPIITEKPLRPRSLPAGAVRLFTSTARLVRVEIFREQSVNARCLKAQLSGERPQSLLIRTLPAAGGYE